MPDEPTVDFREDYLQRQMSGRRLLLEFMLERHRIYVRKQVHKRPPPWTTVEPLDKIYLTNVYRELDTVTLWIKQYVRDRHRYHDNLWFMVIIARLLNLPDSLTDLMTSPDAWPEKGWNQFAFIEALARRKRGGHQIYTQAYMMWGGDQPGRPKHELTAEILTRIWDRRETITQQLWGTLEDAWTALQQEYGLGGFLAYEVVSDLRYTRYLKKAKDKRTWAYAGPGAKRGLNWVHRRAPKMSLSDQQALAEMRALYDWIFHNWPEMLPDLEMREIEHSLCEFSKVMAYAVLGQRPKRWYTGGKI